MVICLDLAGGGFEKFHIIHTARAKTAVFGKLNIKD
jgi:hypothetical protein